MLTNKAYSLLFFFFGWSWQAFIQDHDHQGLETTNSARKRRLTEKANIFIALLFFFWLVLTRIYSGPPPSGSQNNPQRPDEENDEPGDSVPEVGDEDAQYEPEMPNDGVADAGQAMREVQVGDSPVEGNQQAASQGPANFGEYLPYPLSSPQIIITINKVNHQGPAVSRKRSRNRPSKVLPDLVSLLLHFKRLGVNLRTRWIICNFYGTRRGTAETVGWKTWPSPPIQL